MSTPLPRILIVDDQKSVLMTLEALLQKEHFGVTACTNSIDAIAKLTNEPFDLMITDAIMPVGGSGYDLIRTVRSHDTLSKLPVILLTGKRERADVQKGIESGANDYVVKPIDDEILLAKIRNLLSKSQTAKAQFAEAPLQIKAEWETKTEICGVSEIGLSFKSSIPLPVDSLIRSTSTLFDDIGIEKPLLRVVSSEEIKSTTDPHYRIQTYFVGLSERELTPLRLWIRRHL